MTSKPASRKARAMTLAPRSCPSSPGLATTTRYGLCMGSTPHAAVASRPDGARHLAEPRAGRPEPRQPAPEGAPLVPPRVIGRVRALRRMLVLLAVMATPVVGFVPAAHAVGAAACVIGGTITFTAPSGT